MTAGSHIRREGDGNGLEKSSGKIYWYGAGTEILDESDASGNFTNEYVFFGGKRIAIRNVSSGIIDYYEEDMLGSSRTMVQAGQTSVCFDADFLPFGYEKDVTTTCSQNYKFEGKERDTETGNDDFGARYYTFRLGRWLSADWSSVPAPVPYANLTNPQTLNLYAMVSDNPESFADLTGHECTISAPGGESCKPDVPPNGPVRTGESPAQVKSPSQQVQQPTQQNQPPANDQRVGNVVHNETGSLRPSAKEGAGSSQDLHNAKVGIAHVVDNRESAGTNGGVASDSVSSAEKRTSQYKDAQTAAAQANGSPDTTHGAKNYVLDYGQKMPKWVGKMQTVQSFGPFLNSSGGGDVPKGAQVTIRILAPAKPED